MSVKCVVHFECASEHCHSGGREGKLCPFVTEKDGGCFCYLFRKSLLESRGKVWSLRCSQCIKKFGKEEEMMAELFNPKVYLWEEKDSKKICLIEREDLLDLAQSLGTEEQPYAIGKKENLPIVLNKSGYPGLTILHEVWRNEAKTLYEDICDKL